MTADSGRCNAAATGGCAGQKWSHPPISDLVVGFGEMESILPRGDIVATPPRTASGRLLVNGAGQALLPDGAIVVNVARGVLLYDGVLLAELGSGGLRREVVHVFASELGVG